MNTANLQLEGVYAVMAALLQTLLDKAVLSEAELGSMLSEVERRIAVDSNRPVEMRNSNVEAVRFPVRFLKLALRESGQGRQPSFAKVAAQVRQSRKE